MKKTLLTLLLMSGCQKPVVKDWRYEWPYLQQRQLQEAYKQGTAKPTLLGKEIDR
jgi:hypothetical protein